MALVSALVISAPGLARAGGALTTARNVARGITRLSKGCNVSTCGRLVAAGGLEVIPATESVFHTVPMTHGTGQLAKHSAGAELIEQANAVSQRIEDAAELAALVPSGEYVVAGSSEGLRVLLPADIPPEWVEAIDGHVAGIDELTRQVELCGRRPACLEEVAERAGSETFWKRFLRSSCTTRQPKALTNLLYSYAIQFSALGTSLLFEKGDEFPFHLVANIMVMTAVWNEVGCRSKLEGGVSKPRVNAAGQREQVGRARQFLRDYRGYLLLQPAGIGAILAFTAVEDWARGRDVLSGDGLEKVALDALFQLGFSAAYAIPKGLVVSNWLFFEKMPALRGWLADVYVRAASVLGPRLSTYASYGKWLPGAAAQYGVKWIHDSIDVTLWRWSRNRVLEHASADEH